jgi:LacI family transcriptional regulator
VTSRRATLADVAAQAGVDKSTASRILNGEAGQRVTPATRERVLRSAEALGYRADPLARGLRTARSRTLGIAVPQLENPVFHEIILGAERAAAERGYALLISHSDDALGDARHYEQRVRASRVDGLLVATLEPERVLAPALARAGVPFVMVNRNFGADDDHAVFDSFAAARLATEHLLSLGHRRIGHLAGREHGYSGERRLAGYRAALEAAGVAFDRSLVVEAGYTADGGESAMRALLAGSPRPTGVVAATVLAAAGALKALHAAGVRVPEAMSVVAIHDVPIAALLHPQLTTVRLPLRELGERAARGLIDRVEGLATRVRCVLPPEGVVVRASTARPAPGRRAAA